MVRNEETRKRVRKIGRVRVPESNILVARTLITFSILNTLFYFLFQSGVLEPKGHVFTITLIVSPIIYIVAAVVCLIRKGRGSAFQYIFTVLLALFWLELDIMSGYRCKLLLIVLVILSLRYYNRIYTVFAYGVCILILLLSVIFSSFLYQQTGIVDLGSVYFEEAHPAVLEGFIYNNIIDMNPSEWLLFKNGLRLVFVPNLLFLTFITFLALRFMRGNIETILLAEELASKEANQRAELSDMKTKVVLSQVKPHFIYNVLSSIAVLCKRDPEGAKKLTLNFSDYLRNNLDNLTNEGAAVCPFEIELEHVKNYLEIETVRFDHLKIEYDIKAVDFMVPSLSIQPIVENAVKHGICERVEGGTVKISSSRVENGWNVIVRDDGIGFEPEAFFGNMEDTEGKIAGASITTADGRVHVGLANIRNRITLYGGKLTVSSTPGVGTEVTVFIPSEETEEE